TFICAINEEGIAHGSARSVHGFHLVEALDAISDTLVKYGGHPMAAGFIVSGAQTEEMRYKLHRHPSEILSDDDIRQALTADADTASEDLDVDLARTLALLERHGIGNPQPLFLMRRLRLRSIQTLKEKHLKFLIGREKTEIEALWWNAVQHRPKFTGVD